MIIFNQVSKTYGAGAGESVALNNISVQIHSGEIVALCGPSGSGKSTMLNICGLLDTDYSGDININGSIVNKNPAELTPLRRNNIGFIFQGYNLVPVMTAFENVEYPLLLTDVPRQERRERVQLMFNKIGLKGHENKLPGQMSGGQQQRVAIARALIKSPLLVIADEPTANLDTQTANIVIRIIKEIGIETGTTFVIATHDERMSDQCDRVIRMCDGEILDDEYDPELVGMIRRTSLNSNGSCHHAMD